jgi:hypothetical protein
MKIGTIKLYIVDWLIFFLQNMHVLYIKQEKNYLKRNQGELFIVTTKNVVKVVKNLLELRESFRG